MFLKYIPTLIIILLILSPFLVALSLKSILYYGALHGISWQAVEKYLDSVPRPMRYYYLSQFKKVYKNNPDYPSQQYTFFLKLERIAASVLPFVFIVVGIINIFWGILERDIEATIFAVFFVFILGLILIVAWRFGRSLINVQAFVDEQVKAES